MADSLAVSGRKVECFFFCFVFNVCIWLLVKRVVLKCQVVAAYGAVPFPMMHGASLPDALSACDGALPWKPLSACPEVGGDQCYGQWVTLKGFEGRRLVRSGMIHSPSLIFKHTGKTMFVKPLDSKWSKAPPPFTNVPDPWTSVSPPNVTVWRQDFDKKLRLSHTSFFVVVLFKKIFVIELCYFYRQAVHVFMTIVVLC